MEKFIFSVAAFAFAAALGCRGGNVSEGNGDKPKVYMTTEITPEALVKIYEALGVKAEGRVAVKISSGEAGNTNYLQPALIKDLVQKVNGTLVECNTAYPGKRATAEEHLQLMREHGFCDIAQVDIMDAEGEIEIPVRDTKHIKCDIVGSHIANYDFMINLAHFKGHGDGGFGGVLKNQSIGVASSAGKAYIHSGGQTKDVSEVWEIEVNHDDFLESMSAAAAAVADYFDGKILYINVMNNMSVDCDCVPNPREPLLKDIGILASTDPVALDKACLDLVFNIEPSEGNDNAPLIEEINRMHGTHTVEYAAQLGLGSLEYELISLDD